ncbi:MAG: DUF2326 domain-containing protein [Oscillospiraceae bacterium]|nr:DUF2326 domain-containing protein [Oscillospiraceae bacterium]
MFIKNLKITSHGELIRDLEFKIGMNLIIDNTPSSDRQQTGNNVGKTTILKLIYFCLGGKPSIVYTDAENKNAVYNLVKNFLIKDEVLITLILSENLNDANAKEIVIERNFLKGKEAIRRINGQPILEKDFDSELLKLIFPNQKSEKPTFKQIISHNIRYKDENINNTLKTLSNFTSDVEYETLYLFLFGCTYNDGAKKQVLLSKIKQEETFKERLEYKQTKTAYEMALAAIDDEITILNEKKSNFNLNESFETDLDKLNSIKYKINKISSTISRLKIRKSIIEEAKAELEQSISSIDLNQLKVLYSEATLNITGIQKTFEDLVAYHNNMLVEKARFIASDLPSLLNRIASEELEMNNLLKNEKELTDKLSKNDSYEDLERIIEELNEKYRLKGEYESIISQLNEVNANITQLNNEAKAIDDFLFSNDFEELLKTQIIKFNKHFSNISQKLYNESYLLKYDKIFNKDNKLLYKFDAFNSNISSGKKQGEILCFDLAYILFADEEHLSCLHFLLNDKKELMHDNQLIQVAEFVKDKNIQLIVSILKDKLPVETLENAHVVVELSQESKLFKIKENN